MKHLPPCCFLVFVALAMTCQGQVLLCCAGHVAHRQKVPACQELGPGHLPAKTLLPVRAVCQNPVAAEAAGCLFPVEG